MPDIPGSIEEVDARIAIVRENIRCWSSRRPRTPAPRTTS
jgi:hypothetical protein